MSRAVDQASELEARHRDAALSAHRQRTRPTAGNGHCVDCDAPIDPRRLAVQPQALRCIEHQRDHERRHKTHFGRG